MLSLVLPAYNEEKRIARTIKELQKLKELKEIIVVCNGCTDATAYIAKSIAKSTKTSIKVIELPERNKGRAVITGLRVASSDLIGFVDADGAFGFKAVCKLLTAISNADMAIASKWKGQSFHSAHGSFNRKLASRVWNLFVKAFLGLEFSDTQAGLKIMRKKTFEKIGTNFICEGFAFDVELLYKIKKVGGKIKEIYVPAREVKNRSGKSSFSIFRAPSMFFSILNLWLCEKLQK